MANEQQAAPMILQRGKAAEAPRRIEDERGLELLQQVNKNEALASQFPEWDLKPPVQLIRRRSTKL